MIRPLPEPDEDDCDWLPTPEEIASECRFIQATWDDWTRRQRLGQRGGNKPRASPGGRWARAHCLEPEPPDQVPSLGP
jgi:hypothetical protein